MLREPLTTAAATGLLRKIIGAGGTVSFSAHALREMAKDHLTTADALNVLRAGAVQPGEFEHGSWRYRVWTQRMTFVVAFRSEDRAVVVTAWRTGR